MLDKIPNELKSINNWVGFIITPHPNKKSSKEPINCRTGGKAMCNNSNTWCSYEDAVKGMRKYNLNGIGFAFNGNGLIGIDVDECIDNGVANEFALEVMSEIDSYTEYSPSGTGIHIIAKGKLPVNGTKRDDLEMYASHHFFTFTGNIVENRRSDIVDCSSGIIKMYDKYLKPKEKEKMTNTQSTIIKSSVSLSDNELIRLAGQSKKGGEFDSLYRGNWQGKYPSQSEADLALCSNLAFWTGKDESQMDRLFRSSGLMREKWDERHYADGATYGKKVISEAVRGTNEVYTPKKEKKKSQGGNCCIEELNNCYYKVKQSGERRQITNFSIFPEKIIDTEEDSYISTLIVNDRGEVFNKQFAMKDFCNLQSFKKILNCNTLSLIYKGTEPDLELIKEYISLKPCVRLKGYNGIGVAVLDEKSVYVGEKFSMGSEGNIVDGIVSLDKSVSIRSTIEQRDTITRYELESTGRLLMDYNELPKSATILCWCAACMIKPKLNDRGVKFPHLIMTGEQGSGKSTTFEKVVMPFFSTGQSVGASRITQFTLIQSAGSSNIIPYVIDEYKPSTMDRMRVDTISNFLRDLYDGHDAERGRSDMTVKKYKLTSPLILIGEESPDEAALKERSIELLFSKYDISARKEQAGLLDLRVEQIKMLGKAVLLESLKESSSRLKDIYNDCLEGVEKELPPRVRKNIAVLLTGLYMLDRTCKNYGAEFKLVFGEDKIDVKRAVVQAVKQYTLSGGSYNKSVVDKTFEVFDRMTEELKEGTHYKGINNNTEIGFDVKTIYDLFTKYRKDHALMDECLKYNQFIEQLKKKDYYLNYRTVKLTENIVKCHVLKAKELLRCVDLSNIQRKLNIEISDETVQMSINEAS